MTKETIILSAPFSQKYEATRFSYNAQPSIIVAPMTLTLPPTTKTASVSSLLSASILSAPKNAKPLPKKHDVRNRLTGNMTAVLNQGSCGSCWAFSSATAASDVFTLAQQQLTGKTEVGRVDISPMSFMYISGTQSTNMGCLGGNPISTVRFILEKERVLITNDCNDYSWYVAAESAKTSTADLNNAWIASTPNIGEDGNSLPFAETDTAQVRCFEKATPGKDHYQFSLGDSVMIAGKPSVTNTDEIVLTLSDATPDQLYVNGKVDKNILRLAVANQTMMKRHLVDVGSFVIGISVFEGFMSGGGDMTNPALTKSLGDINKSWLIDPELPDGSVYFQHPTDLTCKGGHALTVVGYGSHPKVGVAAINNMNAWYGKGAGDSITAALKTLGTDANQYFIVRNSWGTQWPSGSTVEQNKKLQGYFCLGVFPGNPLVMISHPYQMTSTVGTESRWYPKLAAANPKLGLLSMFVGFSAGKVCGKDCEQKLKTIPASVRAPFFKKLEGIKKSSKTALLEATKTSTGQLAEWSGYLSNNPDVYTNPSTYATAKTNWSASPAHTSGVMSNTVIVIIIASAFLLLLIVAFWLIRRGGKKGRKGRK